MFRFVKQLTLRLCACYKKVLSAQIYTLDVCGSQLLGILVRITRAILSFIFVGWYMRTRQAWFVMVLAPKHIH